MPQFTEREREDLKLLQSLILAIRRFLSWVVLDSRAIPEDMRTAFNAVLWVAIARLENAVMALGQINDTDSDSWKKLDDAGLIGEALRLKGDLWKLVTTGASAQLSPSARSSRVPTGRVKGFLDRVLEPVFKLINSILGSLAGAFPPLELVKEYKDGVELAVEFQDQGERPNGSIYNL